MLYIGDVVSAVPYASKLANKGDSEVGVIVDVCEHRRREYAIAFPSCGENAWFPENEIELIGECPVFRK